MIEPEWIEEQNWFFRLSAFQEQLLALYDERPDFVLPGFRAQRGAQLHRGRSAGLLASAARGQTWGIPIPWDPDQVAYVWADALDQLPERAHLRASGRGPRATRSGPRCTT
mgnify:CR=1 FL=1